MSPSHKRSNQDGFTLLEVLVAMLVLTIAATGLAGLGTIMLTRGRQSKYMAIAANLTSEKLEDLNHWYSNFSPSTGADLSAPDICVPSGASAGSLTSDVTNASVTCGSSSSVPVTYFDDVSIDVSNSSGNCPNTSTGCFAETTTTTVSGVTSYDTTYHSPDGQIASSTNAPNNVTFHRRWLIEANTPTASTLSAGVYIPGTRRITVLVTLLDPSVQPPVTYQMSMVRP